MDVRQIGMRNRKAIDNSRRIGAKRPVGMLLRKGPHPMQITLSKLEFGPIFRTRIQPWHDRLETSRRHPSLNLLCLRRSSRVHAAHLLFACLNVTCKSLIRRHVCHAVQQLTKCLTVLDVLGQCSISAGRAVVQRSLSPHLYASKAVDFLKRKYAVARNYLVCDAVRKHSTRGAAAYDSRRKIERGKSPTLGLFLDQKWEIIHAHSTCVRLSTLVA